MKTNKNQASEALFQLTRKICFYCETTTKTEKNTTTGNQKHNQPNAKRFNYSDLICALRITYFSILFNNLNRTIRILAHNFGAMCKKETNWKPEIKSVASHVNSTLVSLVGLTTIPKHLQQGLRDAKLQASTATEGKLQNRDWFKTWDKPTAKYFRYYLGVLSSIFLICNHHNCFS